MDKIVRRRESFTRIKSLSLREKESFSASIRSAIAASPAFARAETVFAYIALPSEPDLGALIATHQEKRWAFPKVGDNEKLTFHVIDSKDGLEKNAHGFFEPHGSDHEPELPHSADLILVPGVSFDPVTLSRLGRGKGHYDRFLESALEGRNTPVIIGVCFSIQFSPLTPEAHDIPMHRLVTEHGWEA